MLVEAIRAVLAACPFHSEGHRKVIMYVGDYDNSTCDWQVSDRALTAEVAAMAGNPVSPACAVSSRRSPRQYGWRAGATGTPARF